MLIMSCRLVLYVRAIALWTSCCGTTANVVAACERDLGKIIHGHPAVSVGDALMRIASWHWILIAPP
jgi:hypothetical protein